MAAGAWPVSASRSGKLRGRLDALAETGGPSNPMLARPDYEPKVEEDVVVKEELLCIGEECLTYSQVRAGR